MKDQIVIEQMQAQAQAHNLLVNVAEERTHLVDSIVQTNVRRHTTLVFYFWKKYFKKKKHLDDHKVATESQRLLKNKRVEALECLESIEKALPARKLPHYVPTSVVTDTKEKEDTSTLTMTLNKVLKQSNKKLKQ